MKTVHLNTDVEPASLAEYSIAIVREVVPSQKVLLARELNEKWIAGKISIYPPSGELLFADQPGRPDKPILLAPRDMPRRRVGSKKGLIALVHSLVHIELNAIDMAFDLIARFCRSPLPREFLDGAVKVALDEARHFQIINERLEQLGSFYGELPAHGGLWTAVQNTSHDLLARLAIVPLVLEARGLDVSPKMIRQVKAAGDIETASIMEVIYHDEITHVAFGSKWFNYLCAQQEVDPQSSYQSLVKKYFRGNLKPPFNEKARSQAGLTPDFYSSLAN